MAFSQLGLFDLLAPEYLAGIDFPQYVHRYLSILGIDELHTHEGSGSVIYNGICSFTGDGSGAPEMTHADPSGTLLTFPMDRIRFRLNIPRDGAAFIRTEANSSTSDKLPQVAQLLNDLFEASTLDPSSATDLPGTKFTLELFINNVRFSLGNDWVAGEFDASLHKVVSHTDPRFTGKPVELVMPGLVFTFSQGDDPSNMNLKFSLNSFGSNSLDAPNDLGMGEVIRMEPGIALHTSGHVAFSVEQILLDTSQDATPPEILEHFGIGDDWQGIYIKQLLFYYNNDQSLGFAVRLADALFGFDGKVSFEAELDIYPNPDTTSLVVTPVYFHGPAKVEPIRRGILEPEPAVLPADPPGLVRLTQGDALQLDISRGVPPFQIEVLEGSVNLWDSTNRRVLFSTPGTHNIFIKVTDNKLPDHQKFREYIQVVVVELISPVPASGSPADSSATPGPLPHLNYNQTGNDTIYSLEKISGEENPVRFKVVGGNTFEVTIKQTVSGPVLRTISSEREFSIDVLPGEGYIIGVAFAAINSSTPHETEYVQFKYDHPLNGEVSAYVTHGSGDTEFESSYSNLPNHPASSLSGIALDGYASNDPSNPAHDIDLSRNRAQTVYQLLQSRYSSSILSAPGDMNYHGHSGLPFSPDSEPRNRCVKIVYTFAPTPSHVVTGTLSRDPYPPVITPTPPTPARTPDAPPHLRGIPAAFKLLGVRIKIDNNQLSLLEIYCKVDFETEVEKGLREAPGSDPAGTLDMSHEGVVDFKIGYIFDRASQETTISLLVHTEEGDTSGILNFENNANRDDRLKNIAGALLLFAPIMNASASSVVANKDDVGAWVGLVASFGTAVLIGGLNVFRTRKIILYGIEGKFKWSRPEADLPGRWDLGCILDYGIEFDIIVDALGIGQDRKPSAPLPLPRPLKARYRAIGFNIVRGLDGSAQYQPIFDTSKGYELDLSDPSLFRLPAPLGTLFNIVGARVARFNPVTFEVDFAIKVDLGVITVDRFKLKIPLDPVGPPQIIPSGVRVNIPGVIVGNGFVNIVDADVVQPDGTTIHSKGVEGGLDLTLVSLKLRIAGNVALGSIKDNVSGREAIAVFVGLIVEFPTPIILGQSGMGLYGLSGLFAMHYRRIEDPRQPTDAVGPALKWLIKAGGEAQKLYNGGVKLWEPQFDRWSFGVGAVLGTIEGGTLVNLQGMFVLELPGPRILIMIKMRLITPKPKVNTDPAQMELGMIGVIDLDFQQMQLTVGVMVNFEIKELLQVAIPIELYFKLNNSSDWHLYLGTISQPASAKILNIVRGSAYFMIQGSNLVYATYGSAVPAFLQDKTLNAVAIATGIEASILLGDPGSVYLKIAAAAHLGVSFSPFLIVGNLHFEGTLRLIIISIGAHGDFNLMVNQLPDKSFNTYLRGEVCGEVDFFFFSISACISLEIGSEDHTIIPPKLVRGIYLQSYSPVLVSGQASNQKPIDASLGNAKEVEHSEVTPVDGFPIVPIDSVIVLQLQAAPEIAVSLNTQTFTEDLLAAPGRPSGGWYQLSDDVQVQYIINSLSFSENGAVYSGSKPPVTWRLDRPHQPNGADTAIDLAIFSRVPTAAEFAMERSTDLKKSVTVRWENACKPAAPPTRVLYSFCNQPLGASRHGWKIRGIALPDPPDTIRSEQPNTLILVYGPDSCGTQNPFDLLLAEYGYPYSETAEIVGVNKAATIANRTVGPMTHVDFATHQVNTGMSAMSNISPDQDMKKCFDLTGLKKGYQRNPMILENEIGIYTSATKKGIYNKARGFFSENIFLQSRQLKTRVRLLQDVKGVSVHEFMRIDVLGDPVQEILAEFISYRNQSRTLLNFYAYDDKMKLVAHEKWTPTTDQKKEHGQVDIKALNIKYLLISSRYFVGILTRICLGRKITPAIDSCGDCYRALQLPWENKRTQLLRDTEDQPDADLVRSYLDKKPCCRYITIDTESCEEISLFGAVYSKFTNQIQIEELDENNTVLTSYLLSDLGPKVIIQPATELPKNWLDPSLPWQKCVVPVLIFMYSDQFRIYDKILITLRPVKKEACKRIRFNTCEVHTNMPAMYLALADLLTSGKVQHQQTITEIQQTDKKTLDNYLNNNTPRVLMKPDQVYRLNVNYSVMIKSTGQPDSIQSFDQDFVFKTDNKAPAELGSYVLGTTPETEEHFHFYGDELAVVFNDPEILRLYEAYGKHLRAIIRGADGAQVINSPDEIHSLEEIPAEVNSPYRQYVEEMIKSGALPCLGGIKNFEQHGLYTAPYMLKPLMPYTLDIEFIEEDAIPEGQAKTPLFRRAFTTSHFENLNEFAQTHQTYAIKHRALISDLTGLPIFTGGIDPVAVAADKEIEQSLIDAGVPINQDEEKSGFTILWRQTGGLWRPVAMVIDAAEPMWKKRIEPMPKTMVGSDNSVIDPAFVIYEKQEKDHLVLKSVAGEDLVKGFIRSTGGTKTVVVFKEGLVIPASGSICTIQIERPSSSLYGLTTQTETLIQINLLPKAPWED